MMADGALLLGPAESTDGYAFGYVAADNAPGLYYKSKPAPVRRLSLVKSAI